MMMHPDDKYPDMIHAASQPCQFYHYCLTVEEDTAMLDALPDARICYVPTDLYLYPQARPQLPDAACERPKERLPQQSS